jgi:hypothetical protein
MKVGQLGHVLNSFFVLVDYLVNIGAANNDEEGFIRIKANGHGNRPFLNIVVTAVQRDFASFGVMERRGASIMPASPSAREKICF